ncbi:BMP family ABC transporter substrate-binding protein [Stigmatella sp. ncwal1]|uniref:BMP family ABC transporter substrate-binding protein n=1 Tax=Stigmatella ashevillensis TaxID=2995309 RepID=A0ABT5D7S1_9BACT|nr:BMP family ABC transporter substrate-binding protein [Stigmatella ashevillena]MDC0709705.1 BMP family ABC transporter substrate-binding protein [Stigmatella ashevillena]
MTRTLRLSVLAVATILGACKKEQPAAPAPTPGQEQAQGQAAPPAAKTRKVGLITDVGGRGDNSFNDAGLRGLEIWAAGKKYEGGKYVPASPEDIQKTLTPDLLTLQPPISPQAIEPLVIQSKSPEDYEPNLQLLVDQGADLSVGNGFMLESAVETVAKRNPKSQFLLIDSPLLDAAAGNKPYTLPNVRTVTFKEQEGSFLVGALAGLVTKTGKVGFVGGMEVPLIKRFEAGYRAGVKTTQPKAAEALLAVYSGSFDNVAAGKQVAQDLIAKGADVIYHAAGADGLGVIKAVEEARAAGKAVYAIGVDSDQSHLAPEAVLTSMLKHVDLAVYEAAKDLAAGKFTAGDQLLGLKEGGVGYAAVRVDFPGKAEALQKVEALRQRVIAGEIKVPASVDEVSAFQASP